VYLAEMHVLVISEQFPPASSPRAIRWGAIAQAWAREGDRVDVICADHGHSGTGSRSERLRVYPVGGRTVSRWRRRLQRPSRVPSAAAAQPVVEQPSCWPGNVLRPLAQTARWLKNHSWKHVHWPDSACLWAMAARRRASRLLAEQQYDALVTVSNPYSCHLVGLAARNQQSRLPWLVDLGDPFSELTAEPVNNLRLYRAANRRLERRVLQAADHVSVTTPETASSYARQFPQAAGKLHVIPPVLVLPNCQQVLCAGNGRSANRRPRRLVYAGSLYRSIRNPRGLLQLFARLLTLPETQDLELHFYGRTEDCSQEFQPYRSLLGRKILIHGSVDRTIVWEQMNAAHALINLGNATTTQLPSKIIEYAATGRPIINVVQHAEDTSKRWFDGYPSVWHVDPRQTLEQEHRLQELTGFLNAAPTVQQSEIRRFLAPYQIDRIAQTYRRLVVPECQLNRAA